MKSVALGGLIAFLVAGAAVGVWAQVFPLNWDEPEPQSPAVEPGAVGIGGGGISLNPDIEFVTPNAGLTGGHLKIPGSDSGLASGEECTEANRGEIRLIVLTDLPDFSGPTGTNVDVDALCHCTRRARDNTVEVVVTYHWSCYSTGIN